MSQEDWFQDRFDEIATGNSGIVGRGEIAAREFFGNEHFERITETAQIMDMLQIEREKAQGNYLRSLAGLYNAFSMLTLFGMAIGLSWSLYYWITN